MEGVCPGKAPEGPAQLQVDPLSSSCAVWSGQRLRRPSEGRITSIARYTNLSFTHWFTHPLLGALSWLHSSRKDTKPKTALCPRTLLASHKSSLNIHILTCVPGLRREQLWDKPFLEKHSKGSKLSKLDTHTHTHTHAHIQAYCLSHTHTHTHAHIQAYCLSLTHTRTHTHTHTHTHTLFCKSLQCLPENLNHTGCTYFQISH